MSRISPAAAARKRLAERYDAEAKIAQTMADLKRPDTLNPNSTHMMDALAARARTNARSARRAVGSRGERITGTVPEVVPPPPAPIPTPRTWETDQPRRKELIRRSLNEDIRIRRKRREGSG